MPRSRRQRALFPLRAFALRRGDVMPDGSGFYGHWISSIGIFIESENTEAVGRLLKTTAHACSASYSADVYRRAFDGATSLDEALRRLSASFDDFSYTMDGDDVEIQYGACGCDLVRDRLVTSPRLCLCSKESLVYNWQRIFGAGNIFVETLSTILGGDAACRFRVRVRREALASRFCACEGKT